MENEEEKQIREKWEPIAQYFKLEGAIADIISNGRDEKISSTIIAKHVLSYLEKTAKQREVKPKRGIGWVSQNDLYSGK